jgi:hypothetical protein
MLRQPVSSTSLSAVGYDEAKRILEVEFQRGTVYQYFEVPPQVYQELMAAESHGAYFANNVKKAGYSFQPVG